MTTLGLSQARIDEWRDLRTMRLRCLTCGGEVQACGAPSRCRCGRGSSTSVAIAGTVYVESRSFGPDARWEQVGR